MKPLDSVKMPEAISRLKREERGYPIPFFASIGPDGKADLRIASASKPYICHKEKVCWVCGGSLAAQSSFIGGPSSAEHGTYSDGPMHRQCAEYALQVCPYLVIPNANRNQHNLPPTRPVPSNVTMAKPDCFVQYVAVTGDWEFNAQHSIYVLGKPKARIKWEHGNKIGAWHP